MPGKKLPGRFRESEITRAVRGARKGGSNITRIIIGKDNVTLICDAPGMAPQNSTEANEWDEVLRGKPEA
jgi:hypothetical protein